MDRIKIILDLLSDRYPALSLLEGYAKAVQRFENKQIIIFRYSINNKDYALKYYSLEHLEGELVHKEKKAIYDEFMLAKAFEGHPGVINVYEHNVLSAHGIDIGIYFTMDYFELTLDKVLADGHKFLNDDVMSFLKQMDDVLSHAHFKAGIIHSDIKPANIGVEIRNRNYHYKLMDFDVSVRIQKESSVGQDLNFTISDKISIRGMTPAYAAPEQVLAQINPDTTITGKVDTYAVGVIAVQMLTGLAPVPNSNSLFYHVPLQMLNYPWNRILSRICNPDISQRPRKLSDVFPKSEASPIPQNNPVLAKPRHQTETQNNNTAIFSFLAFLGIVVVFIVLNHQSSQTTSTSSPQPRQEEPEKYIGSQNQAHPPEQQEVIIIQEEPPPPQFVVVPDLRDYSLNDARNILSLRGIEIRNIIYQESSPARKERVLLSRPPAGESISVNNASIDIIVGKGPN